MKIHQICAIFAGIFISNAHATIVDDIIDMARQDRSTFCQKGLSILAPSVRAFNGERCVTDFGASIAKAVCDGYNIFFDRFAGSRCDQLANEKKIFSSKIARARLTEMLGTKKQTPQAMCNFITNILIDRKGECNRIIDTALRLAPKTSWAKEGAKAKPQEQERLSKRPRPIVPMVEQEEARKAQVPVGEIAKSLQETKKRLQAEAARRARQATSSFAGRQSSAAAEVMKAKLQKLSMQPEYEEYEEYEESEEDED